ncbi:DMT family transporter [Octadecabacter sp. CECT 8868]|uniref:EamA family transporter n=1 Tax=Octadecabacter algicola TaxID=2909342 RepID=UPI001F48A49C|nr:EamA family transporter [Octadecabacter algicola]MCF2905604.1 DMT family transporter [Octadecabacter algicola]
MSLFFGLIAAGCWGLHDFCVRFISQNAPISACLFAVMVFGLLFQSALLIMTGNYASIPITSVVPLLLAGVSFAVANCGLYVAFQRGPVWLAAPLVACFSVFSIGISVIAGARVSLGQWGAILVILTGIAMVAVLADREHAQEKDRFWTVVSALVAAAAFAITFTFGHAAAELTNGLVTAMGTRVIAIGLLICGIIALRLPLWPKRETLSILAIMGVLDGVAILSIMAAADYPHPEYAAVATAIYGLPTIWLASVFLKERINIYQWAGCLVAFCGIGYLAQ